MEGFDGQFESLKTHYMYIEPEEIFLEKEPSKDSIKNLNSLNQKMSHWLSSQYAPVIETLKHAMSHRQYRNYINNEIYSSDGKLKNFKDGLAFQKNKLFQ